MSTATAFKYYRPFPFCPVEFTPDNYVDVTLAEAMALYWNLENLEFVTTGTRGPASINWTTTFGAVESLPFTPDTETLSGSYYDGTAPASEPRSRVCYNDIDLFLERTATASPIGDGTKLLELSLRFGKTPSAETIRIRYYFRFRHAFTDDDSNDIIVTSPVTGISGTPPSSGTISILGIPMDWQGGGLTDSGATWSTETATLAVTSSAFTY